MSDLNPKGVPVVLDGEEQRLLFTLNVVDEVQDHYGCSLEEVIDRLTDKKESAKTLRYLMMVLLNDEEERSQKEGQKPYTEKEVGWIITQDNAIEVTIAVLKAYGLSLPEPDEYTNGGGYSDVTVRGMSGKVDFVTNKELADYAIEPCAEIWNMPAPLIWGVPGQKIKIKITSYKPEVYKTPSVYNVGFTYVPVYL